MPAVPAVAAPPEEALAWEAAQRPRAGWAAVAAGVLIFASFLYGIVGFRDSPNVTLTDGFRDVLGQPLADGDKGLLTASAMWFDDNKVELLLATTLAAVGTCLIALVLGYLFRATEARRPETSRFILYFALVGPILYGIGPLISAISAVASASSYVSDGVFSTVGAHDALRTGTGISVAQGFVGIGNLATAAAIVLISLNAMRVGLFTRFMGILGCIVGALLILPALFGPPAIVESFWLVAVGLLILGRARTVPPAWVTGQAEPWPTQQQLRERRERGGDDTPEDTPDDTTDETTDAAPDDGSADESRDDAAAAFGADDEPSPARRKRKRR